MKPIHFAQRKRKENYETVKWVHI